MSKIRASSSVAVAVTGYPVRGRTSVGVAISGVPFVRDSVAVGVTILDDTLRGSTPVAVTFLGPLIGTSAEVLAEVAEFVGTGVRRARWRRRTP